MIRQYNGAKAEKTTSRIPAGGYVARVMGAEVQENTWGDVVIISFDIAEGEHKDHFANDYRSNTNEDRKWRGTYRLRIPDENNQYFESQKRGFNNAIYAFEASNNGYHWNWNEKTLKGKTVGVLIREKEWGIEGKTGWTTECCALIDADSIRRKDFMIPKPKPLNKTNVSGNGVLLPQNNADIASKIDFVTDGDLPF